MASFVYLSDPKKAFVGSSRFLFSIVRFDHDMISAGRIDAHNLKLWNGGFWNERVLDYLFIYPCFM